MLTPDAYSVMAAVVVCVYYAASWAVIVRAPRQGTIVPLYQPPENLSPARVRYLWKRTFDDRTFWATVLSVVSKGLATIKSEDGGAVLRLTAAANLHPLLPEEESLLMDEMLAHRTRKGMKIAMLDSRTDVMIGRMADLLRRESLGIWFRENRLFLIIGVALSAIAVIVTARPHWADEWLVLAISFAVMVPATFYLPFLLLRMRDLYRASHNNLDKQILQRASVLISWVVPCLAGITLGFVELGSTFGWPVLVVTIIASVLGIVFLHFIRTPTDAGRKLLDKIEGFRLFLKEVDEFSMNRAEAPQPEPGLYEKFLPYAVALEVEQAWSNRFLALTSSFCQAETLPNTESFYLGMWDGKPVEIVYRPEPPRRL